LNEQIKKQASIFWFTGMSGSGKTTLSCAIKNILIEQHLRVGIIDGDTVREGYKKKLGFSHDEVMQNNLHIASICQTVRTNYDVILVPVISPYAEIRQKVRDLLTPSFHLIYLKTDISSLRARDPKGLYQSADDGLITDLIGYSKTTPYEQPDNAELILNTSDQNPIERSIVELIEFINFTR